MFNIDKFLKKFTQKIQGSDLEKSIAVDTILQKTEIQLEPKDFEIKNYILLVTASPAIKNKLFMFKEPILKEINEKGIVLTDLR